MTDRDQAMLERALDRARALRVDDAVVRARADEYTRWSRPRAADRRAAVWWLAGAGAIAAAAIASAQVVTEASPRNPGSARWIASMLSWTASSTRGPKPSTKLRCL